MLSFLPPTPSELMDTLKTKFRQRRKALGYTQPELSSRSGVSLGSLKRFESSGQIALGSLLKLALVLECLGDFDKVCVERVNVPKSMDEILGGEII
ncbi:MAG: helix-turn-helix transcriptional regulator [Flavobacteriaceae bacterium]|nr:helix-turn-helix transcriptional regulator [Flavobacteriaceae bacterium]